MIYNPARHYPLRSTVWDEEAALEEAADIVRATHQAHSAETHWPAHPLDAEVTPTKAFLPTVYFGVPGVAWTLGAWARETGDSAGLARSVEILQKWVEKTKPSPSDEDPAASLFFGELGDRLALESLAPSAANRERIRALQSAGLAQSSPAPSGELMAGVPGGLLSAALLPGADPELARAQAERVMSEWRWQEDLQCFLWKQHYGREVRYYGAAHGAVANAFALLRAVPLLADSERKLVLERTIGFTKQLAIRDDGWVNWRAHAEHAPDRDLLLHWCHGAPGFLMMLAQLIPAGLDPEFDELLLRAGELVWHAGPLTLGPSLCHGTAGSGAACLRLFERTGDELWLGRARSLAVAALEQVREHERTHGQLRYSLWTGDLGVAWFVKDCTEGRLRLPFLDFV